MEKNIYKMKGKEYIPFFGINPYFDRVIKEEVNLPSKEVKKIQDKTSLAVAYHVISWTLVSLGAGAGALFGLEALLK